MVLRGRWRCEHGWLPNLDVGIGIEQGWRLTLMPTQIAEQAGPKPTTP